MGKREKEAKKRKGKKRPETNKYKSAGGERWNECEEEGGINGGPVLHAFFFLHKGGVVMI